MPFCVDHRYQPLIWITFVVFTVFAGTASIQSAWFPNLFRAPSEQARLDIDVIPMRPQPPLFPTPFFNVYHTNRGKLPVLGFRASWKLISQGTYLQDSDLDVFRTKTNRYSAIELAQLDNDDREMFEGKTEFLSIPQLTDVSSTVVQEFQDAEAGKKVIYVFVSLVYRDRSMPKGVYALSEKCSIFSGSKTALLDCGYRYSVKKAYQLTQVE
jgi:hypothetical protein